MTTSPLRRSLLALASAAALCLASTSPAWADDDDNSNDEKSTTIQFKASVTITEVVGGGNANCMAIGAITGTGHATDMGPVTVSAFDCINFSSPTSFTFQTLKDTKVVLTSVAGEQLFGTYKGTATPQPFPIMVISGTVTFKGGTGRFIRATGTGTITGVENIGTQPATGVLVVSGKLAL